MKLDTLITKINSASKSKRENEVGLPLTEVKLVDEYIKLVFEFVARLNKKEVKLVGKQDFMIAFSWLENNSVAKRGGKYYWDNVQRIKSGRITNTSKNVQINPVVLDFMVNYLKTNPALKTSIFSHNNLEVDGPIMIMGEVKVCRHCNANFVNGGKFYCCPNHGKDYRRNKRKENKNG